ncbi:hypothetical protein PPACK8108_LOCUS18374 [Phakopsora pachyrhizi]|uniref:Uncharacterized protein n=1 Tax=Phakopsora pachyrhizi TaxID=170000 RepID=A0AAV0BB08_PHAPC|nr:hypothetical protein PPACK8108_LOCUS18374 [Phakopsora pachyrhizi]
MYSPILDKSRGLGPRLHFNPFSPLKLLSESKFQSKDQVVELVIKAAIERDSKRRGRIKRVFKENVLGKSLVAGSKLKFERAQLEQWRQNSSTDDNSLPLNNSRPAPSTDPVVVESQSRGDLKVDHQPLLVDKSLTRKLSRVEGAHWRGLFDYVDPVEMNSGFRLMGHSRAETGMGPGIIARVVNLYLDDQMEGSAKLNSKSWWTEFEKSEDWNSTVNAPNGYISFLELMEGMGQWYITCCAAAEDRARLCGFFDGLLKPGGQE